MEFPDGVADFWQVSAPERGYEFSDALLLISNKECR